MEALAVNIARGDAEIQRVINEWRRQVVLMIAENEPLDALTISSGVAAELKFFAKLSASVLLVTIFSSILVNFGFASFASFRGSFSCGSYQEGLRINQFHPSLPYPNEERGDH